MFQIKYVDLNEVHVLHHVIFCRLIVFYMKLTKFISTSCKIKVLLGQLGIRVNNRSSTKQYQIPSNTVKWFRR
jgi:hypothetical protein